MSKINATLICLGAMALIAGCDKNIFDFSKKQSPSQASNKPDHEGWNLTVALDGKETRCGKKVDGIQLWDVDPISQNPTIKISFNEAKLGKLAGIEMAINPIINGKTELQTIYQPKQRIVVVGKEIKIAEYDLFSEGAVRHVTNIPPGEYSLSVRVLGEKDLDSQTIILAVK